MYNCIDMISPLRLHLMHLRKWCIIMRRTGLVPVAEMTGPSPLNLTLKNVTDFTPQLAVKERGLVCHCSCFHSKQTTATMIVLQYQRPRFGNVTREVSLYDCEISTLIEEETLTVLFTNKLDFIRKGEGGDFRLIIMSRQAVWGRLMLLDT
jgi:hypothetical protein